MCRNGSAVCIVSSVASSVSALFENAIIYIVTRGLINIEILLRNIFFPYQVFNAVEPKITLLVSVKEYLSFLIIF